MLVSGVDNRFLESPSPHSLGLRNAMTIPSPGFDQSPLLINQKRFWGAGIQGTHGLGQGDGILGSGVFGSDPWGMSEIVVAGIAVALLISFTRKTHGRLETRQKARRQRKASRLRAKAKYLEEKAEAGGIL